MCNAQHQRTVPHHLQYVEVGFGSDRSHVVHDIETEVFLHQRERMPLLRLVIAADFLPVDHNY